MIFLNIIFREDLKECLGHGVGGTREEAFLYNLLPVIFRLGL